MIRGWSWCLQLQYPDQSRSGQGSSSGAGPGPPRLPVFKVCSMGKIVPSVPQFRQSQTTAPKSGVCLRTWSFYGLPTLPLRCFKLQFPTNCVTVNNHHRRPPIEPTNHPRL